MYKIWDKKKQKWVKNNDKINILLADTGMFFTVKKLNKHLGQKRCFRAFVTKKTSARYAVHFGIGLRDKHNLPMFNGDIVEYETDEYRQLTFNSDYREFKTNENDKQESRTRIGVIRYIQPLARYCIVDFNDMKYYDLSETYTNKISVIGNVYENKDLVNIDPEIVNDFSVY